MSKSSPWIVNKGYDVAFIFGGAGASLLVPLLVMWRPEWLAGPRAPDLSPEMRWTPIVTLFQVALDMAVAVGTLGHGHDYIARHYIPAWSAALDAPGFDQAQQARLIRHLKDLVPR